MADQGEEKSLKTLCIEIRGLTSYLGTYSDAAPYSQVLTVYGSVHGWTKQGEQIFESWTRRALSHCQFSRRIHSSAH